MTRRVTTTLLTKGLGAFELAWIVADRGHDAALKLGEQAWIALAGFNQLAAIAAQQESLAAGMTVLLSELAGLSTVDISPEPPT